MLGCLSEITLGGIAEVFEIITPLVGIGWFLYFHWELYKKNFHGDLKGIYAGYTLPGVKANPGSSAYAGVVLNIKQINSSGYFLGDFDYAESVDRDNKIDSFNSFYGQIDYRVSFKRKVHPLKPETNNTYAGKLYVVDRLDIPYRIEKIDTYVTHEFDILYYREMGLLEIKFIKENRKGAFTYPLEMNLLKSKGLVFEPYKTIKDVVFGRQTFSDRGVTPS